MRIAHIGSKGLPSKGGTERVVEAIATRHAALGHDVTVYGSQRVCRSTSYCRVRVVALPVPANKYFGPVLLAVHSALRALVAGYDVVHVHGAENAFVVPIVRLRSRVVTTNHGPAYKREKWGRLARAMIRSLERGSVRWATVATAVSAPQADALSARHGVRVHYLPNGVDCRISPNRLAAADVLASIGLEPHGYVMFAAARVDPTKGCLTAIRAWRAAKTALPLLVVGDLWHAAGHEAELREAAKGASVFFIPRVEETDVLHGLVAESALFLFPSTVEAMSMMLLEAVSTGARVIASDIAENLAILPRGFRTFRAGDETDLARAIVSALSESGLDSESLDAQFASEVVRTFDWDSIAAHYLDPA